MRILYCSRDYTTHDHRFLVKIASRYPDVYFLRLENDGVAYESRPVPSGVRCVEWSGGTKKLATREELFRLLPELDKVLAAVDPDLVHAGPIPTATFLMSLLGVRPLLGMSWGSDLLSEADADPWTGWASR